MKPVRLIHIGKTGGTALKAMLKEKASELEAKGIHFRARKHSVTMEDLKNDGVKAIVFFVRHPVARFVSSFNSRLRQGVPRYVKWWNKEEEVAFSRHKEPNDLAEALSSDNANACLNARADMQSISHVKDQLTKWLVSPEFLEANRDILFYVGTTETMDEDVVKLFAKMGVTPPDKNPDDETRHATPAEFSRDLSDKAVANLSQWYAKDIEIYEWCLANRAAINGA